MAKRETIGTRLRFDVLTRCNYACFYCGKPAAFGLVQLEVEHVVPVSRGGTNEPWNLVAACRECNAGKHASPPPREVIEAARDLYNAWPGRPAEVRTCASCSRPWVPDAEDYEPNDDCWPCVRAWCDGLTWQKGREQ